MKYIDAERLRAKIKRQIRLEELNFAALGSGGQTFCIHTLEWVLKQIDSLQQELPDKIITLNGIKYKEVPAKTDDKICKECDYFLDNGECTLDDDCPCSGDTILERIHKQEQPAQIDWESEIEEYWIASGWSKSISLGKFKVIARYFIGLALNARKEENK